MRISTIIGGVGVLGAAAVAALLVLGGNGQNAGAQTPPGGARPPLPVPVTAVLKETVPVYLDYVGSTEAIRSIAVQAKVTGYLAERGAGDGADVKAGDLLYRIDPRDYQAALDQAKAQAMRDTAARGYSEANQRRVATLAKDGWATRDSSDQTTSLLHQNDAAIAADQAAIRLAELNLGYAEMRAPFAGRVGRSLVHEGSLISAAGTQLNTLVQLDPLYVTFNPGEGELAGIAARAAQGKVPVEATVGDRDGQRFTGTLSFLDNTVDRATGTIVARATIDNPKRQLLPGQYVRVRVRLGDRPDALTVPQAALGSSQLGRFVYVAAGGKAEQRFVTTGATAGERIVIEKGLAEGELVITGNLQKLGPGAPVAPKPAQGQGGA